MSIFRNLVPSAGAALRALKCGDDQTAAVEMRGRKAGTGPGTSGRLGRWPVLRLARARRRPKPRGPGATTVGSLGEYDGGRARGVILRVRSLPPAAVGRLRSPARGRSLKG